MFEGKTCSLDRSFTSCVNQLSLTHMDDRPWNCSIECPCMIGNAGSNREGAGGLFRGEQTEALTVQHDSAALVHLDGTGRL